MSGRKNREMKVSQLSRSVTENGGSNEMEYEGKEEEIELEIMRNEHDREISSRIYLISLFPSSSSGERDFLSGIRDGVTFRFRPLSRARTRMIFSVSEGNP